MSSINLLGTYLLIKHLIDECVGIYDCTVINNYFVGLLFTVTIGYSG